MADKYLKAIKDGSVVAVGDDSSVTITGEPANTKIVKGAYKVAFDATTDKSLSDIASELVDVPEFTTLPISVTAVTLDKTTLSLEAGATGQLTATVAPSNASDKSITWKSDDTATVTVDSTGKVTGIKAKIEPVNITATTKDGSKTAVCAVTVKAKAEEPPAEGGE